MAGMRLRNALSGMALTLGLALALAALIIARRAGPISVKKLGSMKPATSLRSPWLGGTTDAR
jgi:hypothetical protein